MSENDASSPAPPPKVEDSAGQHLNIKVTDGNNEVFFKIKKSTQLKKLMDAFCDRSGKSPDSVRFIFDGSRVQPTDSPDTVSLIPLFGEWDGGMEESEESYADVRGSSICRMAIPSRFIRSRLAVAPLNKCLSKSDDGPAYICVRRDPVITKGKQELCLWQLRR